jgi:hypothetical protein
MKVADVKVGQKVVFKVDGSEHTGVVRDVAKIKTGGRGRPTTTVDVEIEDGSCVSSLSPSQLSAEAPVG